MLHDSAIGGGLNKSVSKYEKSSTSNFVARWPGMI